MCFWVQEAAVCQVSVPLFTCLPSQVSPEKIPQGQAGGKCQILGLNTLKAYKWDLQGFELSKDVGLG